ncbi:hypothetical protein [Pseudoalteromonas xiamenensis]
MKLYNCKLAVWLLALFSSAISAAWFTPPATPSSGPNVNWKLYYPEGGSVTVYVPAANDPNITKYTFYIGREEGNMTYSTGYVADGSGTVTLPTQGLGLNYLRYRVCNDWYCSEVGPSERIVVFNAPSAASPSVSSYSLGGSATVNWNLPGGTIWQGAYFTLRCTSPTGQELCGNTISHYGSTSSYSHTFSGLNGYGTYSVAVDTCNDANNCSTGRTTFSIDPPPPPPPVVGSANLNWDLYHAQNSQIPVYLPTNTDDNVAYFKVINGSTDGAEEQVAEYSKGTSVGTIPAIGVGFNYIRLKGCNAAHDCRYGPTTRVVIFTKPSPVSPALDPVTPSINSSATVKWKVSGGTIWDSAFFKISCRSPKNVELCGQTIAHIGSKETSSDPYYTQSFGPLTELGDYLIQVQSCNDASHCSDDGIVRFNVSPPPPIVGSANLNWDFYYAQNSQIPVYLPTNTDDNVAYFKIFNSTTDGGEEQVKEYPKGTAIGTVPTIGLGLNYVKLRGCNAVGNCLDGPTTRVVIYNKPSDVMPSIEPVNPSLNSNATVKWTVSGGTIWESAFFKVSCIGPNGSELCGQTIAHIGSKENSPDPYYTQTVGPLKELGLYKVQVQSCNDAAHCSENGIIQFTVNSYVQFNPEVTIGVPFNITWDLPSGMSCKYSTQTFQGKQTGAIKVYSKALKNLVFECINNGTSTQITQPIQVSGLAAPTMRRQ